MNHPWFRTKGSVFSWKPISWKGWMLVLTYVVIVTLPLNRYSSGGFLTIDSSVFAKELGWYILAVTLIFFFLCLLTGDRRQKG